MFVHITWAVLRYCEDRDRELLVEEIVSAYRGFRARSKLTSRAELTRCSWWTQFPSRGRETPLDKSK